MNPKPLSQEAISGALQLLVSHCSQTLEAAFGVRVGVVLTAWVENADVNPLISADMTVDLARDVLALAVRTMDRGSYKIDVRPNPKGTKLNN